MQKNSQDFSPEQIKQFMNSPAGRQLAAFLQQQDPAALQKAADLAAAGDLNAAARELQGVLGSKQAQKLKRELGGD